jgi:histidine triad (HIT) family protein
MTPTHNVGNPDSDCLFCKIVAGAIPSRRIYEDDHAVAFLDIGAWHRGHSLVVPRRHVPDLITGEPSFSDISPAIDAVARLLIDKLAADGINLLSSTGSAAGQEVFHLHVHLVPRYADQPGLDKMITRAPVPAEELDAVYRQIQGRG